MTKLSGLGLLAIFVLACGGTDDDGAAGKGPPDAGGAPTWHQDVAPLVVGRCQGCHQDGGIAPFSLGTYAEAKMWSSAFASVLDSGTMPPFLATETADCKPRFGFKDDLRLSADERELVARWVEAGAPEGDAKRAAPLPKPPQLALDDAEVSVKIPTPVTIEGPGDKFICFSLEPDLSPLAPSGAAAELLGEQVLIDAAQVSPGNAAIVHHVLVFTDPEGKSAELAGERGYYECFGGVQLERPNLVMAWAPGATPITAPEGVAMILPSKGRLVMQVHYHPTGRAETDGDTAVQLRGYRAGIPDYIGQLALIGNASSQESDGMGLQPGMNDGAKAEFVIPANARAHIESMKFAIPEEEPDYRLWAVGTHMHYVGTDMRIGVTREAPGDEPAEECLLATPRWDFNWQRAYLYDAPIAEAPTVKPGDVLNLSCTYDNSMSNRFVAEALREQGLDAPRDVVLGEETLDEMCLGAFGIAQKVSDLIK